MPQVRGIHKLGRKGLSSNQACPNDEHRSFWHFNQLATGSDITEAPPVSQCFSHHGLSYPNNRPTAVHVGQFCLIVSAISSTMSLKFHYKLISSQCNPPFTSVIHLSCLLFLMFTFMHLDVDQYLLVPFFFFTICLDLFVLT